MSQQINSFSLKNTILFKDVQVEIPKGISVFYGLNRINGRKSMQANGAGKSSLWSSLGEILYEEPIVGLKEDTVKQGTRTAHLTLNNKQVEIIRTNSKLEIKVNGKPKQFRKKSDGREWLKKHLPMSQTEFNTYGFLDARVPHPLVMGSSTDRKKFFSKAFGLDKIDVERRIFEAELSKLKRVRAAYAELKAVFDADREKALSKEDRLALEAKVAKLEAELKELNEKNQKLQVIAQVLAFEQSATKQVQAFEKLCPNLEEFSSLYGEVQDNLKDNRRKLKEAREWEEYQRDSRKYARAFEGLSPKAQKLVDKYGVDKALRRAKAKTDEYEVASRALESAQAVLDKDIKHPPEPQVQQCKQSRKAMRAELESLEHRLEHAEKFGSGTCNTCGQEVKVADPKKLRIRIKSLEAALEADEEWEQYAADMEAYRKWRYEDCKKAKAEIAELNEVINNCKPYRKLVRELRDLPSPPPKFEGRKLEVSVCEQMVEEDKAQLALLEFMEPNIETIEKLRALTDRQRRASEVAPRLQSRINEVHEKLSKLKAKLEINSMIVENLRKHKARLEEMKAELVNEEPLRLLVEAYSDKSIKRMAIKAIGKRLMEEVNKYAKLIFPEDYEFGFVWESSKVSLTVHRKYRVGKKTKTLTSDVRKLSGAESKLYTFILVLAHLTFVPQRKRSNVLILDEPTANFSADTTEAFKKLMPILNKVIPSIVIITPRTDERYEGAQEFTVLKEKGEARLVKGHPSTIK